MAGKTTAKTSSRSSDRKKPPSRGATAGGHGPGGGGDDGQPGPTAAPRDPQRLLDLFAAAFGPVLSSDRFPALLQDIKRALFRRDFAAAFADEAGLAAYAARWSPTRALCYAAVLLGLRARLEQMLDDDLDAAPLAAGGGGKGDRRRRLRVLSVGGCAAEQVAVAAYVRETASHGAALTLLDAAPWSPVVALLEAQLTSAPPLSRYASAAARASNGPLVAASQLAVAFRQADALALTEGELARLAGPDPLLVTLLFTLNELYTDAGPARTTAFLRALARALPSGSLLLVVDSPGSYSEAAVGRDKKRYPMHWLLGHTLLDARAPGYAWERLESHDSLWFRLPEGLSYPIQLENMRYQMHLYRIRKPQTVTGAPGEETENVPV